MPRSTVLAIAACTLLMTTAYAEQGTKAMDQSDCIEQRAHGPTAENPVQVLTALTLNDPTIITIESPPTAGYPPLRCDALPEAKTELAALPAEAPCACRVEPRPGW